jgi:hypothetical protein
MQPHLTDKHALETAPLAVINFLAVQGWSVCTVCRTEISKGGIKGHNTGVCGKCRAKPRPVTRTANVDTQAPNLEVIPALAEGAPEPPATGLPDLEAIFSKKVNTSLVIPITARGLFLAELSKCFVCVTLPAAGDASWRRLAAFCKCILHCTPKRGGKRERVKWDVQVVQRLDKWREGKMGELWSAIPAAAPSSNSSTAISTKVRGATNLARKGHYSRALARLLSEGTQEASPEVVATMDRLHPKAAPPVCLATLPPLSEDLRRTLGLSIDPSQLEDVIRSFDEMTATGAMGLKVPHLRILLATDVEGVFLPALRRFVIHCACGDAAPSARPFLSGACLTAIAKKAKPPATHGGTRPVAAGELCRRIVAKAMVMMVRTRYDAVFVPEAKEREGEGVFRGQFGVGAKCGTERVIHIARAIVNKHRMDPDFVAVKVDATNAFNMVNREYFTAVDTEFPEILPWVRYTYGDHAVLWFGAHKLSSQCGVQQGDPLGPLIFSVVMLPLVLQLDALGLISNLWYLDDGFIAGPHATVIQALAILDGAEARKRGLLLNRAKCEVIWCGPHQVRDDAFSSDYTCRLKDGNFELLGSPIGSPQWCCTYTTEVATKRARAAWEVMTHIDDAQVALTLLRQCAHFNRVNHLMRSVPPSFIRPALKEFDEELMAAFVRIIGIAPTSKAWEQAKLSSSKGGLGLRSAHRHAAAAYSASVYFTLEKHGLKESAVEGYDDALAEVTANIQDDFDIAALLAEPNPQKALSAALDTVDLKKLVGQADKFNQGRLTCCSQKGAATWVNAKPTEANRLTTPEMTTLIAWWLGDKVYEADHVCPVCRKEVADARGFHSLTCIAGGSHGHRHNAIRQQFVIASRRAGFAPRVEPANLLGFSKCDRPADFETTEGSKTVANDVCVMHPLRAVYLEAAITKPGQPQVAYVTHEKGRFVAPCAAAGIKFRPLCVDAFGNWSEEGTSFIRLLAKSEAARSGCRVSAVVCALRQALSITLMRGNAKSLLRRRAPELHPVEDPNTFVCDRAIPALTHPTSYFFPHPTTPFVPSPSLTVAPSVVANPQNSARALPSGSQSCSSATFSSATPSFAPQQFAPPHSFSNFSAAPLDTTYLFSVSSAIHYDPQHQRRLSETETTRLTFQQECLRAESYPPPSTDSSPERETQHRPNDIDTPARSD